MNGKIPCPYCSTEISDWALLCHGCGRKPSFTVLNLIKEILLVIMLMVLSFGMWGFNPYTIGFACFMVFFVIILPLIQSSE